MLLSDQTIVTTTSTAPLLIKQAVPKIWTLPVSNRFNYYTSRDQYARVNHYAGRIT